MRHISVHCMKITAFYKLLFIHVELGCQDCFVCLLFFCLFVCLVVL